MQFNQTPPSVLDQLNQCLSLKSLKGLRVRLYSHYSSNLILCCGSVLTWEVFRFCQLDVKIQYISLDLSSLLPHLLRRLLFVVDCRHGKILCVSESVFKILNYSHVGAVQYFCYV